MVPTRWRCRTRYRPRMSLYQSFSPTWMQSLALVCDDAKYNSSQYLAALVWNGRHEKSCTAHESCQTTPPPDEVGVVSSQKAKDRTGINHCKWHGRYIKVNKPSSQHKPNKKGSKVQSHNKCRIEDDYPKLGTHRQRAEWPAQIWSEQNGVHTRNKGLNCKNTRVI